MNLAEAFCDVGDCDALHRKLQCAEMSFNEAALKWLRWDRKEGSVGGIMKLALGRW